MYPDVKRGRYVTTCTQSQKTKKSFGSSSQVKNKNITVFFSSPWFNSATKCLCAQAEGDRLPPGHTVSQLETCKIRSIRAGTLERLVETLLTAFGDNDLTYTSIFLSTYRAFTSTQTVLQLLLDR